MKKYIFTQEDVKFVQKLLPDIIQVILRNDNTTMDTCTRENKYIESVIVNVNLEFEKEVEKYFATIGKVSWNNSRSCWSIYIE